MAMKQSVMIITVVYETPPGNSNRTRDHIPHRVIEVLEKVQNTVQIVGVHDETGRQLGRYELTKYGMPSLELRSLAELELGAEPEPEALGA